MASGPVYWRYCKATTVAVGDPYVERPLGVGDWASR